MRPYGSFSRVLDMLFNSSCAKAQPQQLASVSCPLELAGGRTARRTGSTTPYFSAVRTEKATTADTCRGENHEYRCCANAACLESRPCSGAQSGRDICCSGRFGAAGDRLRAPDSNSIRAGRGALRLDSHAPRLCCTDAVHRRRAQSRNVHAPRTRGTDPWPDGQNDETRALAVPGALCMRADSEVARA